VKTEAKEFRESFLWSLANSTIKTVSNALGLPIIVFSSTLHYPVANTTPRACNHSLPLYNTLPSIKRSWALFGSFIEKEIVNVLIEKNDLKSSWCPCSHNDNKSISKQRVPVTRKSIYQCRIVHA